MVTLLCCCCYCLQHRVATQGVACIQLWSLHVQCHQLRGWGVGYLLYLLACALQYRYLIYTGCAAAHAYLACANLLLLLLLATQGAQQRRAERLAMRGAMAAVRTARASLDGCSPSSEPAELQQQQQLQQQRSLETVVEGQQLLQ
jgi:predicted membrane metal-binding protein